MTAEVRHHQIEPGPVVGAEPFRMVSRREVVHGDHLASRHERPEVARAPEDRFRGNQEGKDELFPEVADHSVPELRARRRSHPGRDLEAGRDVLREALDAADRPRPEPAVDHDVPGAGTPARHHAVVDAFDLTGDPSRRVAPRGLTRVTTDSRTRLRFPCQSTELLCERLRVSHRVEHAVDVVGDGLDRAALVGRDDGQAGSHSFHDHQPERLRNAGAVDQDIGAPEHRGRIVDVAGELDTSFDAETSYLVVEMLLVRGLTEERPSDDEGSVPPVGEGLGERPEEQILALPRRDAAEHGEGELGFGAGAPREMRVRGRRDRARDHAARDAGRQRRARARRVGDGHRRGGPDRRLGGHHHGSGDVLGAEPIAEVPDDRHPGEPGCEPEEESRLEAVGVHQHRIQTG